MRVNDVVKFQDFVGDPQVILLDMVWEIEPRDGESFRDNEVGFRSKLAAEKRPIIVRKDEESVWSARAPNLDFARSLAVLDHEVNTRVLKGGFQQHRSYDGGRLILQGDAHTNDARFQV